MLWKREFNYINVFSNNNFPVKGVYYGIFLKFSANVLFQSDASQMPPSHSVIKRMLCRRTRRTFNVPLGISLYDVVHMYNAISTFG